MDKQKIYPNAFLIETHKRFSLHYLTGHDFVWYLLLIGRPVVCLAVFNIIFYFVSALPALDLNFESAFLNIIFSAEVIVYIWLGAKITLKNSLKTLPWGMKLWTAALSGGLTGFFLGVLMSLFKIFWFQEIWTIYNIVTEPAIRMLEGLIIAGLTGLITLLVATRRAKNYSDYSK